MANFCSNCGKQINENQDVCLNCGTMLNKNEKVAKDSEELLTNKRAYRGYVLGWVAVIAWFLPLIGYPVNICGIISSASGLRSKIFHKEATAGLALCVASLIITLFNSLWGIYIFTNNFK